MSTNDSDYDSDIALELEEGAQQPVISAQPKAYEIGPIQRLRKHWTRFAKNFRTLQRESLFSPPPTVPQIQAYLKWRVRRGQGRLDSKMNVSTLRKEFNQLERALKYEERHQYSPKERDDIYYYISKLPGLEGASTRKRPKPVGLFADIADIIYFLMCCDEYVWVHPREMIQTIWILELMGYWGLRPGEITESCNHRGSNEGISYEDCSLYLVRSEGTLTYQLKILLKYRKFKRNDEGLADTIVLHEETKPEHAFACPVRMFISMALADDAFEGPKSFSDFAHRSLPLTASSKLYRIRADKCKTPVIRATKGASIHPSRILSASTLRDQLVKIGQRCGYQDNITAYAFRRGFANGIEGKVAANRLRQLMGHANDGTFQSYLSNDIAIDTQNAVRGLPQDLNRVDLARSIRFTRDIGAPLPAAAKYNTHAPVIAEERIQEVSSKFPHRARNDIIRQLRKADLRLERQEYFLRASSGELDSISETQLSLPDPVPSELFNHVLKVDTHRRAAIDALWCSESNELPSFEVAIQPLTEMARPQAFYPTYPFSKQPHMETCTVCDKKLREGPYRQNQSSHIIFCYAQQSNRPGHQFCLDCLEHIPTGEMRKHDEAHLELPDLLCAPMFWRGLLLRPGRCPFCLANRHQYDIFPRWEDKPSLAEHILAHLAMIPEGQIDCPHPSCHLSVPDKDALRDHFGCVHGIQKGYIHPLRASPKIHMQPPRAFEIFQWAGDKQNPHPGERNFVPIVAKDFERTFISFPESATPTKTLKLLMWKGDVQDPKWDAGHPRDGDFSRRNFVPIDVKDFERTSLPESATPTKVLRLVIWKGDVQYLWKGDKQDPKWDARHPRDIDFCHNFLPVVMEAVKSTEESEFPTRRRRLPWTSRLGR